MTTEYPRQGTALTGAEVRVLAAIAQGHSIKSAAELLNLAPDTIKSETKRARRRLGANHTGHAIAVAIRTRQLDLDHVFPPVQGGGELS